MAFTRAIEPSTADPAPKALQLAGREFDRWLRSEERSAVALRVLGPAASLRERLLGRVRGMLQDDQPGAASCQWVSESIGAWAPLELLFPVCDHAGTPGVSGDISLHAAGILERVYGHVIAGAGDFATACAQLQAEVQRLDLEISVGRALCGVLDESGATDTFWVEELRAMQLAMAEYLHRHAMGLKQLLSDTLLTSYTARIGRLQRTLRERYAPLPMHVQRAAEI